ncbi:hypothetical protein [Streptomyces sp. AM8-1-1]|uniref:hypothetical protein n=1 Tax=Streptomyces sp. AM8-1-1 TaxID=3075825 RepID=UPI0028C3A747|nr:hypothetical protein [Streptomyces sp. AM8-1-1]WNO73892.1 hypothetical protein RPQ07_20695 [Streptomyces sp. AM8-1-1]
MGTSLQADLAVSLAVHSRSAPAGPQPDARLGSRPGASAACAGFFQGTTRSIREHPRIVTTRAMRHQVYGRGRRTAPTRTPLGGGQVAVGGCVALPRALGGSWPTGL